MNGMELVQKLEEKLKEIFSRVRGIEWLGLRRESVVSDKRVDLDFNVQCNESSFRVLVEVKSNGLPRTLREAARQLKLISRSFADLSNAYQIVAAPYISDVGMDLCKEEGVGCFDLVGNCYISFGTIYIEMRGNKNLLPTTRSIKSIFSPKSSRITRVLLADVKKWWRIQGLAKEANVSLGLASNIKNRLLDEDLLTEDGKSVRVKSPKRLLDTWANSYSYRKNKIREYYTLENPASLEMRVQAYCIERTIRCALGLFSGASRVAPHVRFNKAFIYVDADVDLIVKNLGLKPVSSGANIALLQPYDEGIFYKSREIDGLAVVSSIQLYLDLKTYKGRGEEAADFLLKTRIEPEWQ